MPNLRPLVTSAGLMLALVLGAGCSDDSDDSGGSSATQLKDLSPAELEARCNETKSDFDELARGGCMLDARDSNDCEATAATCAGASGIDCNSIIADDVADCTVTVGELRSCLAELAEYFSPISCTQGPAAAPPSCMQSVQQKCSIFG